jgi:hypothetical protein
MRNLLVKSPSDYTPASPARPLKAVRRRVEHWLTGMRLACPRIQGGAGMEFSAKIEGNELVIRLPLNEKPERSASGKTIVVASTRGKVGINAYIPVK